MLKWASDVTLNSNEEDLLELYCGGGTFTAVCALNFRRVLATEMSKVSVELATKAFKANNINNIKIARLTAEEFSEAYLKKRKFKRLEEANINLFDYKISTVLVDPPRAGLDNDTCILVSKFDKIVYISCNPDTLARDIKKLVETHTIEKVAAFDQFPYTHHLESGVFLVKKKSCNINDNDEKDSLFFSNKENCNDSEQEKFLSIENYSIVLNNGNLELNEKLLLDNPDIEKNITILVEKNNNIEINDLNNVSSNELEIQDFTTTEIKTDHNNNINNNSNNNVDESKIENNNKIVIEEKEDEVTKRRKF
jgi:hypothetical protein